MNAGSELPCVDTKTPSPVLPASSNQPWKTLQHHFTNPSLLVDCMEKLDHELSCLRRELQLRCHCSAHAGRAPCNKSRVLHCLHQSTQDVRDVFAPPPHSREHQPLPPLRWKVLYLPQG